RSSCNEHSPECLIPPEQIPPPAANDNPQTPIPAGNKTHFRPGRPAAPNVASPPCFPLAAKPRCPPLAVWFRRDSSPLPHHPLALPPTGIRYTASSPYAWQNQSTGDAPHPSRPAVSPPMSPTCPL